MSNNCIGYLYANNCKNLKGKYKILYNNDMNYMVKGIDGIIFMKDFLLDVKVNRNNLFISAEQGMGKNEANIFVVYLPIMK